MKGKDLLKYALSVAAALVLLYFSFRSMDWGAFVACLKACRWEYVLVTMLCCTGVQWVRALRYRMLLRPMDASLPFRAAISSVNIGMLANLVLPRAGELVRCGYVTRHSRRGADGRRLASVDKVLGTVVVERGWDVVFWGCSSCCSWCCGGVSAPMSAATCWARCAKRRQRSGCFPCSWCS